jgi:hypothetical protein
MSLTKAQRRYFDLLKQRDELWKEAEAQRLRLVESCKHPEEARGPYSWMWDNGYGRQKMMKGAMCRICHAKDPYDRGRFD